MCTTTNNSSKKRCFANNNLLSLSTSHNSKLFCICLYIVVISLQQPRLVRLFFPFCSSSNFSTSEFFLRVFYVIQSHVCLFAKDTPACMFSKYFKLTQKATNLSPQCTCN